MEQTKELNCSKECNEAHAKWMEAYAKQMEAYVKGMEVHQKCKRGR